MRLITSAYAKTKSKLAEERKEAFYEHSCPSCFFLGSYYIHDMYFCVEKRCVKLVGQHKLVSCYYQPDCEYAPVGSAIRIAFLITVDLGFMKRDPIPEEEKVDLERCECCKKHFANSLGLKWVSSYTQYSRKTGHPDPNRNLLLCDPCADLHTTLLRTKT